MDKSNILTLDLGKVKQNLPQLVFLAVILVLAFMAVGVLVEYFKSRAYG